jgi:hypothetical protein
MALYKLEVVEQTPKDIAAEIWEVNFLQGIIVRNFRRIGVVFRSVHVDPLTHAKKVEDIALFDNDKFGQLFYKDAKRIHTRKYGSNDVTINDSYVEWWAGKLVKKYFEKSLWRKRIDSLLSGHSIGFSVSEE